MILLYHPTKKNDSLSLSTYLKSKPFSILSSEQKKNIIQFETHSYFNLFIQLGNYHNSIEPFFSSIGISLAQDYIKALKEYKKVDELENLAKIVLYPSHLYAVDNMNYSVLYYLCSKGFNPTLIKHYIEKGAKLISSADHEVHIMQNKYFLFTVERVQKAALVITGSQKQGNIESGLESALHQKNLNVISINTNSNNAITEQDIYSIVRTNSNIYDISLIIINIHGGDSVTDVVLDITQNCQVAITSKAFFSKLVEALKPKAPIEILLTSCNGQLATKIIHNISLPTGSKFVTLGENDGKNIIHTSVLDMQNIAKILDLADIESIDLREINVVRFLTDYLMHMTQGNGSPTFTITGNKTESLKTLNTYYKCAYSLIDSQITSLINKLCDLNNSQCYQLSRKILSEIIKSEETDITGEVHTRNLIKDDISEYGLGPVLALQFNYALFAIRCGAKFHLLLVKK